MLISLWIPRLLLFIILSSIVGCGYHFTNSQSANGIGSSRSIWIPFFKNETVNSTAQTVLRRAFYDELHALRGLTTSENEESADIVVKAKIISFSNTAVSYSALDQVKEFRLDLNLELEILDKSKKLPLWRGQLQGSKQYPANTNLSLQHNSEDLALDAAARIIAHKFITSTEESY
ncbi:MAG: LPS assembly lipoprotein LptE [Desulfuromonadaceae bacterium]|nr:LPS assembly lipoprotein LptE [Desulfuromonadaceae bacterium]MDD2855291.1 LPS assembly lipoprotein LptE [Desulfuromonadaceae bacterium]